MDNQMATNEKKQRFIQLRASGLSFNKISKELNVSKPTLIKWQRELREAISNEEFFNLQALLEQYKLSRSEKFERLSKVLSKVWEEIEQRDLSNASLKDLLQMKTLLDRELKEEVSQIQYFTGQQSCPVIEAINRPVTIDLSKM